MSLHALPAVARWYVLAIIGLGTAGLLAAVAAHPVPGSPGLAGAVLAAAVLGSRKLILVGLPGEPGSRTHLMSTLSLGFPAVLASALWFGSAGGLAAGVASGIGACLYPRCHPLYRLWFTVVNLGTSGYVSGWLMQRLGTAPGSASPAPPLALLAATLVYYALNTGMVAIAVALSQGAPPWTTWRQSYLWTAPSYLAGAVIVGGAQFLYLRWGGGVAGLSLACLYLVHLSYKCYLEKVHQLQASERQLRQVCLSAVESLAVAIEARDSATHDHIRRVQHIALALGERVGVTPEELEAIRVASLTHDVGKLAVPDTILSKAGRLTLAEFERVKTHVEVGASILEPVQFPWPVIEIVRTHHERWDGQGYPAGLKGEEIPIGGRIVAIADVFDALTSPRPYRTALTYEQAHAVICSGSGTQFDPRLVEAFSAIFPGLVAELSAADAPSDEGAAAESTPLLRVWDEIRGASRESHSMAFTDPLTGLGNSRHLETLLPRELEAAQRESRALSVLVIDLDGFKAINDTHGHLKGDAVLQMVARVLEASVREGSTVCRYAGDEFVIVLPGAGRAQAERVADRLRARTEACRVPGTREPIRLSLGIAAFPENGAGAKELLERADQQMYAEKAHRKEEPLSRAG